MNRVVPAVALLLALGLCLPGVAVAEPAPAGAADALSSTDGSAAPGATATAEGVAGQSDDGSTDNGTEDDGSADGADGFGQQVSSFMQSTESETDGAVEQGLWEARVERNGTPEDVANRTERLRERLESAQAERERLREARANGSISQLEYAARMARLSGELQSVASAANRTETVGERVGADTSDLEAVRERARNASGPPEDTPGAGGPPDDAGPGDAPGDSNETGTPDGGQGSDAGSGAGDAGDGNSGDGGGGGNGDGGPPGALAPLEAADGDAAAADVRSGPWLAPGRAR